MRVRRVLDVYCGIGGLSLGFMLAVRDIEVTGVDIDRDAVEAYNYNLSKRFNARAVAANALEWKPEKFDMVIGGSPCQPFSVASSRKGESHPLFPTFRRFFEIVSESEPAAFLFENVKGLLSRRFRHLFESQVSRLSGDYRVSWAVLDAADYGVPQRRRRLFAVGLRKDVDAVFRFPHAQSERITVREALEDVMSVPDLGGDIEAGDGMVFVDSRGNVVRIPWTKFQSKHPPIRLDSPAPTIMSHLAKSSRTGLLAIPAGRTVIYRRLTVRECLRLQSFPDWWEFPPSIPVSRRYRLAGEAVPPVMAYRLAVSLAEALKLKKRSPGKEDWDLPYFDKAFGRCAAQSEIG